MTGAHPASVSQANSLDATACVGATTRAEGFEVILESRAITAYAKSVPGLARVNRHISRRFPRKVSVVLQQS
jgi:hypothetical protein